MVPIPLNYRCPLAPSTVETQRGRQLCVKQAQEGWAALWICRLKDMA